MDVKKITPRGYCYGVIDAVVLAQNVALDKDIPRPIYILGMIVHNKYVVEAFNELGIISLDGENRLALLDKIERGTVILTAHGVSPKVRTKAKEKGLTIIDATCPDVAKTHSLIKEKTNSGYEVIYIGKNGHPEPEGAVGVSPEHVHLITNEDDVAKLQINPDKVLITNQTTMSQWDIANIMNKAIEKYPKAKVYNEICMATQTRQEAVAEQAKDCDIVVVVGDPKSNNTNRLAKVAEEVAGVKAYRIADLSELNLEWLKGMNKVAVTAGASTPTYLTKEVISFLENFDEKDESTWDKDIKIELRKILPRVKK